MVDHNEAIGMIMGYIFVTFWSLVLGVAWFSVSGGWSLAIAPVCWVVCVMDAMYRINKEDKL